MARFGSQGVRDTPAHIAVPRLLLLLAVLALMLVGFVMVYSASSIIAISEDAEASSYLVSQVAYAVVGIACALVTWRISYRFWAGPAVWVVWAVAIALLVLTAVRGSSGYGATRWLAITSSIGFQPSEFVKIAFVLVACRIVFDLREGRIAFRVAVVQAALMLLVPLMVLYRTQSDLGTTVICFVGILAVMWIGEVPLRTILVILAAGVVFALLAILFTGYRSGRLVYLDPWNDGEGGYGDGYQIIRSYYAFSEGGILGVGLGNSHEKYLYLFAAETDFIFAVIGEEMGMLGALAVIALYLLFLYAGMRIVRSAPDGFAAMIAGSCAIMLVFQAFLNIGCVIGVLPTTGKPLPFISSGGSSLVASLIMVGLIMSVSRASNAPSLYERRRADLRVVRAQGSQSRTRR